MNVKFVKKLLLATIICALGVFGLGEGVVPVDGGVTDKTDYHAPKEITSKETSIFMIINVLVMKVMEAASGAGSGWTYSQGSLFCSAT